VDALKGLISESDINRFDLVSNAVFVKGGDVAMVRSAVSSNPLAASLVKQISSSNTVVANLGESVPLIGAPQLWELTSGSGDKLNGTGIKIGILDTGVDYTHPDLGGCFGPDCKVAGGYDFVDNDNDPFDTFSGHGTSVAAIAAGIGSYRDSAGTTQPLLGVAPGAKIYAYRVLEQEGFGTEANVMNGLERCVDPDGDGNFSDRLDVCNLSFNTPGTPDSPLSLAVDAASAAGVVVVVSAGEVNDRDKFITMGSPANARSAITVGASCKPGDTSRWCNDGIYSYQMAGPVVGHPDIFKPDVVAPGVEICAALALKNDIGDTANCLDDKHIIRSGTSFAAPHVAGLAALLKQAYPTASPETVKALVSGGAKELPGDRQLRGAGLVNAYDSYSKLQGQSNIATLEGLPLKLDLDPARGAGTERRVVKITNTTNAPRIFTPSLLNSSLSATFTPNEIELAPGEQGLVTIDFSTGGTDAASGSLVQGLVSFTS
jgi:subtilisin family serine protease